MTTQLIYKIVDAVGEETTRGNAAFERLEQLVNEHTSEGWTTARGVAVCSVTGPKTVGSTTDNGFVRIAQALVRGTEE